MLIIKTIDHVLGTDPPASAGFEENVIVGEDGVRAKVHVIVTTDTDFARKIKGLGAEPRPDSEP